MGVSAAPGAPRLPSPCPLFSPLAFREGCSHPLPEAGLEKGNALEIQK